MSSYRSTYGWNGGPKKPTGLNPTALNFRPGLCRQAFSSAVMLQERSSSSLGGIRGCIPYGTLSLRLAGGIYETFAEGCFDAFLESDDDALVLAFHNPEHV